MPLPAVGAFLPTLAVDAGEPVGDVVAAARHAEAVGLESAWVIDQLVTGGGMPVVESVVALSAAAAVTTRLRLGLGVLVVPLRPVAWIAKQVGSLQHLSGDRLILGVGVGGERHDTSWAAAGVSPRGRGARTDAALDALPALLRGEPATTPDGDPGQRPVRLLPAGPVPPIVVGGGEPAMRRAVRIGAGWFPTVLTPEQLAAAVAGLGAMAAAAGRPRPPVTVGTIVAMTEDPELPGREALVTRLGGPAFGLSRSLAEEALVTGTRAEVEASLAAYAEAGADRVVASFVAGDWERQAGLLAEAAQVSSVASSVPA
ncbi:MAG: LLM class flavin-dependent oxidoreductase [Thermoleophilia bacterium]